MWTVLASSKQGDGCLRVGHFDDELGKMLILQLYHNAVLRVRDIAKNGGIFEMIGTGGYDARNVRAWQAKAMAEIGIAMGGIGCFMFCAGIFNWLRSDHNLCRPFISKRKSVPCFSMDTICAVCLE